LTLHEEELPMSATLYGTFFRSERRPRDDKNKKHQFMDILFLVIAAVISGAEGWEAIETFGQKKLEWLRKYFPFANGVPSHDCIRMVMLSLSPKALQGVLRGGCRPWSRLPTVKWGN
jgi:hypothetical protein